MIYAGDDFYGDDVTSGSLDDARCRFCDGPLDINEFDVCDECTGLKHCIDDMCHGIGHCIHNPQAVW